MAKSRKRAGKRNRHFAAETAKTTVETQLEESVREIAALLNTPEGRAAHVAQEKVRADAHAKRISADRAGSEAKKRAIASAQDLRRSERASRIETIRQLPLPERIELIAWGDRPNQSLDFYPTILVEGPVVEIGRANPDALRILFRRALARKKGSWRVWANSLVCIATAVGGSSSEQ